MMKSISAIKVEYSKSHSFNKDDSWLDMMSHIKNLIQTTCLFHYK